MRIEMLTRVTFLVLCGAFVLSGTTTAQPPPPPPPPPPSKIPSTVQWASIEIVEVNPTTPTAGQVVTITYKLTSTGFANKLLKGYVAGNFQGQRLVEVNRGTAPWVTLQPNETQTGQLIIASAAAGDGTLTVTFNGPLVGCTGVKSGTPTGPCGPQRLATISTQLIVAQPTVHVRISGATYTNLSRPDSHDGSTSQSGYQCVVHNPGCGWWGNNGSDKYFNTKSLPPGAKLERNPNFLQFWPNGIDSGLAGGNGLGTGSYGASLSSNPGNIEVKWNNACWSVFGGKDVYYSISFLVAMPKGMDLGEPISDPASQPNSPCALQGYSRIPEGEGKTTVTPAELYLLNSGTWFQNTFGSAALGSSGTIQSITNGENFQIELLSDSNMPGGCGKPGNVPLGPHGITTSSQLNSLYGSQKVVYPKVIGACTLSDLTATRQSILTVITYVPLTQ